MVVALRSLLSLALWFASSVFRFDVVDVPYYALNKRLRDEVKGCPLAVFGGSEQFGCCLLPKTRLDSKTKTSQEYLLTSRANPSRATIPGY
jgi:hypothetical protein